MLATAEHGSKRASAAVNMSLITFQRDRWGAVCDDTYQYFVMYRARAEKGMVPTSSRPNQACTAAPCLPSNKTCAGFITSVVYTFRQCTQLPWRGELLDMCGQLSHLTGPTRVR